MATKTKDGAVVVQLGNFEDIGIIASDTVFEGSMVGDNGAGYGRPLVAGDKFRGHCFAKVDNESGSAGDKNIRCRTGRYRLEVDLVALITDVGQPVYASDDNTLSLSAPGNSYVGVITRYVSSTKMIVEFRVDEFDEFGENQNRVLKTDDYTTLVTDTGQIIYLGTDTKTITLIATVAGIEVTIVQAGGFGTALIHVDPNAADNFLGGCGLAAGGDGKKLSNTKATAQRGDYLRLIADGTGGWNIVGKRGTWAQEA